MRLNFYYPDNTRSSLTIDDKLCDVWALATGRRDLPSVDVNRDLAEEVIPEALKHYNDAGRTLTKQTEWEMLEEIACAIQFDYVRKGDNL